MYVHPRGPARDIQCISRMSIPYTLWERSHSLVIHTLSTIYPISCRCKWVAWITTASIFPSVGSCQLSHILPIHCGLIILSYPADIRLCVVYWLAVGYPSPCSDDIPIPATTSLSFTRAAVLLSTWTDTLSRLWPNPAVTGTKSPIWPICGHAWPVGRQHCPYEPALLSARYIATSTHDHPAHQATGGPISRLMDVLLHSLRRYSDTGFLDSSDAGICTPNHSGIPQTWRQRLGQIWSSVSATGVHQPCTPLECTQTQPPSRHYPRSADVGGDVVQRVTYGHRCSLLQDALSCCCRQDTLHHVAARDRLSHLVICVLNSDCAMLCAVFPLNLHNHALVFMLSLSSIIYYYCC